jgi:dipeptidase E
MRMYLSSFRLGDHPEQLVALTGEKRRVAVIANAMDAAPAEIRHDSVLREVTALTALGYQPTEVDLRTADPATALDGFGVVWVRGGNAFVLRAALAASGADVVLTDLIRTEAVVYGGYSAGCCVLAPSLRGLELVDDPSAAATVHWDGLGILDYAFVPHYRSDHPESADVEKVAEHYLAAGVPHRLLRDGEAIVVT